MRDLSDFEIGMIRQALVIVSDHIAEYAKMTGYPKADADMMIRRIYEKLRADDEQ